MKEKLYTIEVMDALKAADECPCCYLERKMEQETIAFVLGASYMEDDIRAKTDEAGFCRHHTKMMYDYGNSLGNAWILKTRLDRMRARLKDQARGKITAPAKAAPEGKPSFFSRLPGGIRHSAAAAGDAKSGEIGNWMKASEETCYVCSRFSQAYGRIIRTFLYLIQKEPEFLQRLKASKGFCLPHFADLLEACQRDFSPEEQQEVVPALYRLMEENLERIQEDINWFIDKFDYRNTDADWKTSRDAVPRTMQKLTGGYPADPVFRQK